MTSPSTEGSDLIRSMSIVAIGNISSRLFGMVREIVKAGFFGAGSMVDALSMATIVPTVFYDLLVGGMVSSALIPVLSEYNSQEQYDAFWRLVSVMLSLSIIILAVAIVLLEIFASQMAFLLLQGSRSSSQEVLALTTHLLRITVPALLFLSISGILSGILFARKHFTYPALAASLFNITIVITTLLLDRRIGVASMAVGLLAGAVFQVALQTLGLRDARVRFQLDLRHPGLRRIVLLYIPVMLGLLFNVLLGRLIGYNIAYRTGEGSLSWMTYATTLIQFPQGLVATAVSTAILPTLSAQAATEHGADTGPFRATLAQGLRLVILLIMPATLGLFILATPIVDLLFEHGNFGLFDTSMTAWALRLYLIGLPFAAVDLLLISAFYARQDTLTPALTGMFTTIIYLTTTILLLPYFGFFSLMIADSIKHILHTAISALILHRRVGQLAGHRVRRMILLSTLMTTIMGLMIFSILRVMQSRITGDNVASELLVIVGPGLGGTVLYVVLMSIFYTEEIRLMWKSLFRRLGLPTY